MSSRRLFEGLHIAELYAKYRPTYPKQVIERILTFMKVKAKRNDDYVKAVDVGCGSGQLTRDLAPYFKHTIGVDVSEAQIKFARNLKTNANVEYRVGSEESIPVESSSVDLVTCAQAVHWFDFNKFCGEVDRILKPKGCVALIGYTDPIISYQGSPHQGLNQLFDEYINFLKPYIPKELQVHYNKYRDLKLPYAINERDDSLTRKREVNLSWFLSTLTSCSHYQKLMKATEGKSDPLLDLRAKVGSEESIPVESSSVDLVTCAQAVHWFDFNKFCGEVDRILKPKGCVALIGYTDPIISYQGSPHQGLNQLFDEYINFLKPYIPKELQVHYNKYRDLKLPYAINERDDSLTRKREVNLSWFLSTLTSCSHYQKLMKATEGKSDPLLDLRAKMIAEVGDKASADEIEMVLEDSIFMVLAAKSSYDSTFT